MGANLLLSDFRLDPPEQVFAIVMGETEVGLGRQFGPLDIRDCRSCKLPASSMRSSFNVHFIENPSLQEFFEQYSPFLDRPPTYFRSPPDTHDLSTVETLSPNPAPDRLASGRDYPKCCNSRLLQIFDGP